MTVIKLSSSGDYCSQFLHSLSSVYVSVYIIFNSFPPILLFLPFVCLCFCFFLFSTVFHLFFFPSLSYVYVSVYLIFNILYLFVLFFSRTIVSVYLTFNILHLFHLFLSLTIVSVYPVLISLPIFILFSCLCCLSNCFFFFFLKFFFHLHPSVFPSLLCILYYRFRSFSINFLFFNSLFMSLSHFYLHYVLLFSIR